MTDTAHPRQRRPRNSLTVESILDAGEGVASAGFEALTVRAVADELGASPMALYRYFATKDELVDALLDRVLGRIEPAPETDDPLEDLAVFALYHRAMLLAHPWAIAPLFGRPLPGPNALPIGENALRILSQAGITGDDAVAVFSGILALNYGWAAFTVGRVGLQGPVTAERIAAPPDPGLPLTASVAEAMGRYGSDEHYGTVLTALLTGVGALAGTESRAV
ncbi:TetR/AcrR family transcriptional regulator [Microbacterium ulmi]|uniref:TetR/AcrR family transcriptional regulator n=1 Tax=Microbacterium ulmi TaxID=179095 RepID=A0A7Y2LYV4_9MICO|nr:TetR/AcrR family transcriptional regulator [Microbacterium ulmi]NII71360.1 AcrR family transcriptional regulator [Microbacterium ulmi]NNH02664.1 TetR/AcrR family transcriptional regulator [Microbacterium ulmi]